MKTRYILETGDTITIATVDTAAHLRRVDDPSIGALVTSGSQTFGPYTHDTHWEQDGGTVTINRTIAESDPLQADSVAITGGSIAGAAISGGSVASKNVVTEYAEDGAIAISPGTAVLTKESAGAYTLAAPTASDEGTELVITSKTEAAHVVTATGLLEDGVTGDAKDEATFAAFLGASITLEAIGLVWHVKSANNVTVAAAA